MAKKLNGSGASHAASLIRAGTVKDAGSWEAPSAEKENAYIEKHGLSEYGKWHLGVDAEAADDAKGRYSFPFSSDFEEVNYAGLRACITRAAQAGYSDIEKRARTLYAQAAKKLGKKEEDDCMELRIINFEGGRLEVRWNEAEEEQPVEVMLYDTIGGDPWGGKGVTAEGFRNGLKDVPRTRDLHLRVNSHGGDVHEGMAIKTCLDEWPKRVVATIDGVAASTASWIPMGCDEVRASKDSQMFIHDAIACGFGNAEDLRKTADALDKTSDQIAGMYAAKSGKGQRTMRQLMRDETLLTGQEAKDLGLVDTVLEDKAVYNFTPGDLRKMKEKLRANQQNSAVAKPLPADAGGGGASHINTEVMNKAQIIALLGEHGVTMADEATDQQLQDALRNLLKTKQQDAKGAQGDDLKAIRNEIASLKEANQQLTTANTEAKRIRITNEIELLITNDRLPAVLKDKAIKRAMADDTYLDELKSLPERLPGSAPLSASRVELTGESFTNVQNFMLDNGPRFTTKFLRNAAGQPVDQRVCLEIRDRAMANAAAFAKHRNMLTAMFNTNTIDPALQRIVILQEMIEEFAIPLLPLQSFSAVFNNVPLEGTDQVAVPFYPLQTAASNSWDPTQGYAAGSVANTATQMRQIAVGGSGTTSGANAAAGTAKDRKWIGMAFSSYEKARQPYLNIQKLGIQNANKLGVDIFKDIVSRCITIANYGGSVKAIPAAAFSGDDVADLWEDATGANWPERGRSLVLSHKYKTPLLKDPTFKQYLSYGSTDPLRKAAIQEAYGFEDIPIVPNLDSYSPAGENLVGWINWLYALLVATAPIMPTEEVRALMTRYDVVVHPKLGIAFEYRRFGDTTLDVSKEIVECSYGAAYGVQSALKRIVSGGN